MRSKLRFIGNLLFHLFLFGVLFSYGMFQGGFVSWFLFYSFLPILSYQLILLSLPVKKWKVKRDLSRRILQAGGDVDGVITLERNMRFPLYYLVVEEVMPGTLDLKYDTLQQASSENGLKGKMEERLVKEIVLVGFQKVIEIPYTLDKLPRGEHRLQTIRISVRDVFGFVKKEYNFTIEDEIIVQPNEWEIDLISSAADLKYGQAAENSFPLQQTNNVRGVREYVPGDRFAWIDWKQTAKSQTVMTKEFEQERNHHLLLVLDATLPNQFNPLAFEASVELASTLLRKIIHTSTDVDFLTLGAVIRNFAMKESHHLHEEAIRHLTRIIPGGKKSFSNMLGEIVAHQMKLGQIVILTTWIDESFQVRMQSLRLRARRLVIIYIQEAAALTEKEMKLIGKMKRDGLIIQILTDEELRSFPLEVNI